MLGLPYTFHDNGTWAGGGGRARTIPEDGGGGGGGGVGNAIFVRHVGIWMMECRESTMVLNDEAWKGHSNDI